MSGAGAKIFMDILPRLNQAELQAVMQTITGRFNRLGRDIEGAFGSNVGGAAATAAERNAARMEQSMRTAQAGVARSMEAMARAQDGQANAANRLAGAQAAYAETMAKGYEETSSRAIYAMGRVEAAQRSLEANTRAVTASMNENLAAQARAMEAQRDLTAANAAVAGGMGAVATAASKVTLGVGIGMAGAFAIGVDHAAKLQEKLRLVQTTGDESNATMDAMRAKVLDLQSQWGYSADTIAEALRSIEQAGFRGSDAMKILDTSVKGAHSEHADLNETAKQLTTTMHDFNFSVDQSSAAMSKSIEAVFLAKTNLSAYSAAIGQVEKTAKTAHISIEDMNAAVAMSTQHGASIEDAANRWAHAIQTMQSMQGPQLGTINQLGFTQNEIQEMMADPNVGLGGTMEVVQQAILSRRGADGQVHMGTAKHSADAEKAEREAFNQLGTMDPTGVSKRIAEKFRTNGDQSDESWGKMVGHLSAPQQNMLRQWKKIYDKSTGFSSAMNKGLADDMSVEQAMKLAFGDMPTFSAASDIVTGVEANGQTNKNYAEFQSKRHDMATLGVPDANGAPKGSEESQQTLMAQLHNLRGSISSLLTEEGQSGIQPLTDFVKALADGTRWLGQHGTALKYVTEASMGAAAALIAVKMTNAVGGLFLTPGGAPAAARLAGVAGRGISALGSGLASAGAVGYNYVGSLAADATAAGARGASAAGTAAAAGMRTAGTAIVDFGAAAANAAASVMNLLKTAAVSAFVSAWQGIKTAVVAVKEFELGAKLAAAATKAWTAIQLAFDAAMAANPLGLIVIAIAAVVAGVVYAYTHFEWFRNIVDKCWEYIKGFGEWLGGAFVNSWNKTYEFLHMLWSDIYEKIFKFELDLVKGYLTSFIDFFKNIGHGISEILSGVKDLFSGNVDGIKKIWDGLKDIVAAPVKFVVETVYNGGIVKLWNGVSSVFGDHLGHLDPLQLNFAGGGVLPGYQPGRDTVPAMLSPGEGVAVPELVQAIGPGKFMALNHAYSRGRPSANETAGLGIPHAEGGGVFGAVGDAAHWVADKAEIVASPVSALNDLFQQWIDKALGAPGESGKFRDAIVSFPRHVLDGAIDTVKGWVGLGSSSGTASSGPGAQRWKAMALQALAENGFNPPELYIDAMLAQIQTESSGNEKAIQQVIDVNSGGNEAAGLLQVTPGTFAQYRNPNDPNDRLDAKANMDAALRYMRGRYHGDILGVWGHGHGYEGGGIVDPEGMLDSKNTGVYGSERRGEGAPSSLPNLTQTAQANDTAVRRAVAWVNSVAGTPYTYGELDCSGFLSGVYDQLLGKPVHRAFTTVSDFLSLGFKRGLGGVFSIGVNPKPGQSGHMAGELAGHRIESGGSHGNVAIDGPAVGPTDPQFSEHYFLPGEMFNPPYTAKGSNSLSGTGKYAAQADKAAADAQKKKDQAAKYLEDAKKADEAAAKHLEKMRQHQADAAEAQRKAADAILDVDRKKYEKEAQKAQEAATTAKEAADNATERAQGYRDKASKASSDATDLETKAETYRERSVQGDTTKSGTGSANHLMTPVEFGQQLGGLAVSGLLETFGLENSVFADPNKSPLFRIANAAANAKYVGPQSLLDQQASDDDGTGTSSGYGSGTSYDSGLTGSEDIGDDLTATPTPDDYIGAESAPAATPSIGTDPQAGNPMGQLDSDPHPATPPAMVPVKPPSPLDHSPLSQVPTRPAPSAPSGGREPGWGGSTTPTPTPSLNGSREPGWGGQSAPAPSPKPGSYPQALLDMLNGTPTHDEGGWIGTGLSLVNNLTGKPEPVLNPRQKDNLDRIANRDAADGLGDQLRSMVHVENQHIHDGDFRKAAREWVREMNAYMGGGTR